MTFFDLDENIKFFIDKIAGKSDEERQVKISFVFLLVVCDKTSLGVPFYTKRDPPILGSFGVNFLMFSRKLLILIG